MASFVCVIGYQNLDNWGLCRDVGAYGIPRRSRGTSPAPKTEPGDRLFVYLARRGYIAEAQVSEAPREPTRSTEAPWPGGTYAYAWIVPFTSLIEVREPIALPFGGVERHPA